MKYYKAGCPLILAFDPDGREGLEQSILDEKNQLLRAILVKAHKEVDSTDDVEAKRGCLKLLREMHSHRKVSDLLGLVQQADS